MYSSELLHHEILCHCCMQCLQTIVVNTLADSLDGQTSYHMMQGDLFINEVFLNSGIVGVFLKVPFKSSLQLPTVTIISIKTKNCCKQPFL